MKNSPSTVKVTVNVTCGDFYSLQIRYLVRKQWWLPLALGIALYGITGLQTWALITGVVGAVLLIPLMPAVQWRRAKKLNPNFGAPTTYTFSDTGMLLEWPATSVRYDWPAIKELSETSRYLLIHLPPDFFYFLPKRELSASDLAAIRELGRPGGPPH